MTTQNSSNMNKANRTSRQERFPSPALKSVQRPNEHSLFDFDFNISLKAQMSPKVQDFLDTSINAGKIIIKTGKILIPMLLALGVGMKSLSKTDELPELPPSRQIESVEKSQQ